jgi:hypothetical protein
MRPSGTAANSDNPFTSRPRVGRPGSCAATNGAIFWVRGKRCGRNEYSDFVGPALAYRKELILDAGVA